MGIFSNILGRGDSGGIMNAIRCDEQDYLIWKWRPAGQAVNSTSRENAIRYGSSLSVKEGEVAVFCYKQPNGVMQDFIEGPYNGTIKTANFPVLAGIVGMAFGGDTPFQAEIYFINLQGNNQIKFAVPYFGVMDPRLPDLAVPVAVAGTITFNITDYRNFIKLTRLQNFDLEQFKKMVGDAVKKYVKAVVSNLPSEKGIPLIQIERQILQVNDYIQAYLAQRFSADFGVNLKMLDISRIDIDKDTPEYLQLKAVTNDYTVKMTQTQQDINLKTVQAQGQIGIDTMKAQSDVNIQNLRDTQRVNTQNMEETMRIQRETMAAAQMMEIQEKQRQMRAQTENNSLAQQTMIEETAAAMRAQTEGIAAAMKAQTEEAQRSGRMNTQTAFPQANIIEHTTQMMGNATQGMQGNSINLGGGNGTGFNPGAAMAGMAVGSAMGQQMGGMINQMGNMMQQQLGNQNGQPTPPPMNGAPQMPPPMPDLQVYVAVNGQQSGPFNQQQLQQLVQMGQLTPNSMVWMNGLPGWAPAQSVPQLASLLTPNNGSMPPPMPPTL